MSSSASLPAARTVLRSLAASRASPSALWAAPCRPLSTLRLPLSLPARPQAPPTPRSSPSGQRGYAAEILPRGTSYRDRQNAGGPFTWKALAIFLVTGAGLVWYFRNEKRKIEERKREELSNRKIGRAKVGGPFTLVTQEGKEFTDKDLLGKFSLIYFGFTNCPDICPEELDKMGFVVDALKERAGETILPVFISVDPARDGLPQIRKYLSDFHPNMIGLSGPYDEVKATCKAYRVYFSTPPNVKPGDDYLVDHSIFFYFMDPDGQFIDAFGRSTTKDEVAQKVEECVGKYKRGELYLPPES